MIVNTLGINIQYLQKKCHLIRVAFLLYDMLQVIISS
jgi:hypothetical protein